MAFVTQRSDKSKNGFGNHKLSPRIALITVNGEQETLLICRCYRELKVGKGGKLSH